MLIDGDHAVEARRSHVAVVDRVGVGDASIGGLQFSLMVTPQRSWEKHLAFSLVAGAAACSRSGAHSPTVEGVTSLLEDRSAHCLRAPWCARRIRELRPNPLSKRCIVEVKYTEGPRVVETGDATFIGCPLANSDLLAAVSANQMALEIESGEVIALQPVLMDTVLSIEISRCAGGFVSSIAAALIQIISITAASALQDLVGLDEVSQLLRGADACQEI